MRKEQKSTMRRYIALVTFAVCLCPLLRSQSYYPLFQPNISYPITWTCEDENNNPVPYATYYFDNYAWDYTNGHFHDSAAHPWSSSSPQNAWDQNGTGSVTVNLNTTIIGQAEGVDVTCYDVYGNPIPLSFNFGVGYPLNYNDDHGIWVLVGGNTTNHGDNSYDHWMTTNAAYGIYYATQEYQTNHPEQGLVAANDQGLPFGGKFDINDRWDKDTQHVSHDWGTAADIRGNGGANGIPRDNSNADQEEFRRYCQDFQAVDTRIEFVGTPNQHIHCRWGF
jgi:hypothetical protein